MTFSVTRRKKNRNKLKKKETEGKKRYREDKIFSALKYPQKKGKNLDLSIVG